MPALTAMRYNEQQRALFVRLVSKHGIKMKAVVAVQRKILELIYSIFKSGKPFEKNYLQTNVQKTNRINEESLEQSL
jgi:transposase